MPPGVRCVRRECYPSARATRGNVSSGALENGIVRAATGPTRVLRKAKGAQMNILAWIVLGAIAGYIAGLLVRGDEGLGVIGHIVLGIVGAIVGGFVAGAVFGVKDPIQGALDISTIVVAVIGAVLVVLVVSALSGSRRTGAGPI
jgi:uncharacterized membrane protein YeaQ/YmgE (transglycosylase-associated protein family)